MLVRPATSDDLERTARHQAAEAADLEAVREVSPDGVTVLALERLLDGERRVVYYASEDRVPVPELPIFNGSAGCCSSPATPVM